jgi:hypothetical protein
LIEGRVWKPNFNLKLKLDWAVRNIDSDVCDDRHYPQIRHRAQYSTKLLWA